MAPTVTSKQLLEALDYAYSARFGIVREVTIVDPDEVKMAHSFYAHMYPDYYLPKLLKRGINPDDLPDSSEWLPGRTPTVRRIDALMVALGASDDGTTQLTAVECKISRADFKRDTEEKRRAWFAVTNRFVYLVPEGLITPEETPDGCGLWYWVPGGVNDIGRIVVAKRAQVRRDVEPMDISFTPYLLRRVSIAESKLRALK